MQPGRIAVDKPDAGFDAAGLRDLSAAVERDIAGGLYFGGVIGIMRGGDLRAAMSSAGRRPAGLSP